MLRRPRIALFVVLALSLFGAVLFTSLRQVRRAQESEAQVVQTQELRRALNELLSVVQEVESGARGYALTGAQEFLEPFSAGLGRLSPTTAAVRSLLPSDVGQRERFSALERLIQRRVAYSTELVRIRRTAGIAMAQAEVSSGRGRDAMDSVRTTIRAMDAATVQLLNERDARSRREVASLYRFVGIGSSLAIVLLLVVLAMLVRENEKRRLAQAELDRFFTLSLDMLCISSADGHFKRVSPAFTETLGWSVEEMLARPFLEAVHPDDRAATLREVERQVAAGEKVMNFENRYQHKDGSWRILSWKSAPQPGGLMYATARDVTAERTSQEKLTTLRHHFESIVISVADGLHELDLAGRIVFENPASERMLGYAHGELLGRPAHLTIHHHRADGAAYPVADCPIYRTLNDGETRKVQDEVFWRKDGTSFPVDFVVSPTLNAVGERVGAIAVFHDVTERKQAEDNLRRAHTELITANAELAKAAKLKDEFLANVSHELRTPLNAILGLSETLLEQDEASLTPRQVRSIATISASGAHLLDLINDVLDLSKVEAGKLVLHARPMRLDDFAQGCLAFIRTQAAQKELNLSFEPGGPAAWVSADPKRLKQVLVNLLSNAVKFTPNGGRIGLSVSAPEGEQVVRITVWDTGIGIAEEDQRRLFRPFTQIDSGLNRTQEGTGLGLALVHRLVALHDGQVQLESELGRGSRFVVTLPRIAAMEADTLAPVVLERPDFHQALIIEDDPTAADILVRYLAELQIAGAVHRRAEGALEAALRTKPDVILLDILLPDDSGWVVLTRLKEHSGTRDIPVLVISIVDEPEKAVALGAAAHLVKPVTRAQLAGVLHGAVGHNRHDTPADGTAVPDRRPLVLLAEDNEANRETIGGYLEDKGFDMRYAVDGVEAVAMACRHSPALILMDIQMPVKDGIAAIREIRAVPSLAGVPIVALTALVMPGDRERCLEAGATEYLSKPVSLKGLTALVQGLLSGVP